MSPGDVALLDAAFTKPPKPKFAICVDHQEGLHLLINTKAPYPANAGVPIAPADLACLRHDSFVDTAQLLRFYADDVDAQLAADPTRHKGSVPANIRTAIKETAKKHGLLPPQFLELIETRL